MNYYTYAYLRENRTPYYIGKDKGNRINSKNGRVFLPPLKERRIYLKQNLTEENNISNTSVYRHLYNKTIYKSYSIRKEIL